MERFVGTKIIEAKPATKLAYNQFRGWKLPGDESGDDEGYLTVQPDSESNTEAYTGYVSWAPKAQFEATYERPTQMSFESAIYLAKRGEIVTRASWNGTYEVGLSMHGNHLYLSKVDEDSGGSILIGFYKPDHNDIVASDWTVAQLPAFNFDTE
jgi:hypothetical protein